MRKKLIFDLDGTLVNSVPDIAEGMNIFLQRKGLPFIEEKDVKLTIGKGAEVSLKKLLALKNVAVSEEEFGKLYAEYIKIYQEKDLTKTHLWPGVKETLTILQEDGYEMAVCTNKPKIPAENILAKLDIKKFFKVLVNPDTAGVTKPNLKIMQDCLSGLGADACECVMIGDSETDVSCAKVINVPAILLTFGYALEPYETMGADRLVNSFAELPEAIRSL